MTLIAPPVPPRAEKCPTCGMQNRGTKCLQCGALMVAREKPAPTPRPSGGAPVDNGELDGGTWADPLYIAVILMIFLLGGGAGFVAGVQHERKTLDQLVAEVCVRTDTKVGR